MRPIPEPKHLESGGFTRVEVVVPVLLPALQQRLDVLLDSELADPKAWELRADGAYARRRSDAGENVQTAQEALLANLSE